MRRFIGLITTLLLFIWLLPLGAFIKPEQEKEACAGKRAICLCSHLLKKQLAKNANKTFLQAASASSAEKENTSGSSHNFLAHVADIKKPLPFNLLNHENPFKYSFLYIRTIDPVPKA